MAAVSAFRRLLSRAGAVIWRKRYSFKQNEYTGASMTRPSGAVAARRDPENADCGHGLRTPLRNSANRRVRHGSQRPRIGRYPGHRGGPRRGPSPASRWPHRGLHWGAHLLCTVGIPDHVAPAQRVRKELSDLVSALLAAPDLPALSGAGGRRPRRRAIGGSHENTFAMETRVDAAVSAFYLEDFKLWLFSTRGIPLY